MGVPVLIRCKCRYTGIHKIRPYYYYTIKYYSIKYILRTTFTISITNNEVTHITYRHKDRKFKQQTKTMLVFQLSSRECIHTVWKQVHDLCPPPPRQLPPPQPNALSKFGKVRHLAHC